MGLWDGFNYFGICLTVYGGWLSWRNRKKYKQIQKFVDITEVFYDTKEIIKIKEQIVQLSNPSFIKGKNLKREIGSRAKTIKNLINNIEVKVKENTKQQFEMILKTPKIDIIQYLNTLISGEVIQDDVFRITDEFNIFEKTMYNMQKLVQEEMDRLKDKLLK